MPKLTLSASSEVIDKAKQLADERGTSVSGIFSQFIKSMGEPQRNPRLTPKTKRASGLIKLPKNKTNRQLIEDAITDRFMR